jgi:SPP1 family predicted phage head-tail adaptor
MSIGDLNQRITIQSQTRTADGMGGWTETWATLATVWAAVWPVSAREILKAGQTSMEITHRIKIRYRAGVDPSYRILFGTRYFSIMSIINVGERGEWLELLCKENG